MAIISEGGILATGGGRPEVAVNRVQQVYGLTVPISSGQRALYGHVVWMSAVRMQIDMAHPPGDYRNAQGQLVHDTGMWFIKEVADFVVDFGYPLVPQAERTTETGLLRVWINDRIVYDAASPTTTDHTVKLKFYDGSATQLTDAAMLADLGDLAPGQHNKIYLRFSDWQFSSVLNSMDATFPKGSGGTAAPIVLPLVKIELADGLTITNEKHSFTMLSGSSIWQLGTVWDWANDTAYAVSAADTSPANFHTFSISNELELSNVAIAGASYTNVLGFERLAVYDGTSNYIITALDGVGNTEPIACINSRNGQILDTFGVGGLSTHPTDADGNSSLSTGLPITSLPYPIVGDLLYVNDGAANRPVFAFGDTFYDFCLLPLNADGTFPPSLPKCGTFSGIHNSDDPAVGAVKFPDGSAVNFVCHAPLVEQGGGGGGGQDAVAYVGVGSGVYAIYIGFRDGAACIFGGSTVVDFGAGHTASIGVIDPTDTGLVIFEVNNMTSTWTATKVRDFWQSAPPAAFVTAGLKDWRGMFPEPGATNTLLYTVSVPNLNGTAGYLNWARNSNLEAGTIGWYDPAHTQMVILNLSTGSQQLIPVSPAPDVTDDFVWDSRTGKLYYPGLGGTHTRSLDVATIGAAAGASATIGEVLRWYALLMGFDDADIYVDPQLTDPVLGTIVDRKYDGSALFNDLGQLYDFQYFESDGKIKFVRAARGDSAPSPAFDITTDDLASAGENTITPNDTLVTVLAEPAAQINNVSLLYSDFDQSYSWITQTAYVDTESSGDVAVGTLGLGVPIVFRRADAYHRINQLTIRANQTADMQYWRLPQRYMRLEPSDVIAITKAPFRYVIRIDEATFNADWTQSYGGVTYSFQDDIPVTDDPHVGTTDTSFGAGDAKPFAIDVPLLFPSYIGPYSIVLMDGVISYGQDNFAGAGLVFGPPPAGPFEQVSLFGNSIVFGATTAALPDTATPFQTDDSTTITVALRTGTSDDFLSTDADGLLAGTNTAVIGLPGRYEYVYFRDVAVVNDKVVTLSGLERGRRGTDTMVGLHEAGDNFYLLRSASTTFKPATSPQYLPDVKLNTVQRYNANGASPTRAPRPIDILISGYSAFPWAPSDIHAKLGSHINLVAAPDYTNPGGTGDRTLLITVTGHYTVASVGSTPSNLVDGGLGNSTTDSIDFAAGQTDVTLLFDFTALGLKQIITGYTWRQNVTQTQGHYLFEGSDDLVTWTTVDADTELGAASSTTVVTFANSTAFYYYRLRQISGVTNATPWVREVEFKTQSEISADDLLITWLRRDRADSGFWVEDAVELNDERVYDVEVFNGASIAASGLGLTQEVYVLTSAAQATGGLAAPLAVVSLKVYQKSTLTGRGFAREVTVNVE